MKMLRYPLAAIVCVLLAPVAAHAGFSANVNGPSITVNGTGIADDRYPATLKFEGGDGPITKVRAFVSGVTHSDPDALDLALVPPTGNGVVLMSDACGPNLISNRTFVFDPTAASTLDDEGPCLSGPFLPSNFSPADEWPAPGPLGLTNTDLDAFVGRNPNGDWKLFARNDVNATSGQISGWGLEITTATASIVVPAVGSTGGVANQYPLTKTLDVPDGQVIDDLNLKLTAFNHQHPADVDMLLQGPRGEAVMAMSDACGSTDINFGLDWTFDDEAPVQFGEDFTNCTATSIRPVDHGTPLENLPAPAPARPYAPTLSTFDGLGGGTFRLFINDDAGGDTGYIDAVDLIATTRPAAATGFTASAVATAEGQTATLTVTRSGPVDLGPATLKVDIGHSGTDPSDLGAGVPSQLQFARGETSKTVEIPVNSDFDGEGAEDFVVSLSDPVDDARLTDATSFAVVTIAPSPPDNRFTVGAVERLPNGRAKVTVTIPNPGTIAAADAGPKELLKPTELNAENAGRNVVTLKPAKKAKRKLKRGKKVTLTAELTYTPFDGTANSADVAVKLKRKR